MLLLSALFAGCSKPITEVALTQVVSDDLLRKSQSQVITTLGEPQKKQKRTGGYSAYYFEDSEGAHAVVIFNEKNEAINIATTSNTEPHAVINRLSQKSGWKEKEGLGYYPAPVVYEHSKGFILYENDSWTYIATTE